MTAAVSIGLLWWLWLGTGEGKNPILLHTAIVEGLSNRVPSGLMLSHETLWTALGALLAGSDLGSADEVLEGMTVPSWPSGLQNIPDDIPDSRPLSDQFETDYFVGVYLPRKPRGEFEDTLHDMGVDLFYPNQNRSLLQLTAPIRDELITGKIPAVIPESEVFLMSAAEFQGSWADAGDFNWQNHRMREFRVDKRRRTFVDSMYSLPKQRLVAELVSLRAKMLLLPLKDSRVKFMVLLPNLVGSNLKTLEELLKTEDLRDLLRVPMDTRKFDVILPKMDIMTNVELAGNLGSLGIRNVFHPNYANLKPISLKKPPLYVRRFQHVTKISLNGQGINIDSEDKGHTVITRHDPGPAEHFYAMHPFFFALLDEERIYATGRYGNFAVDPEDQ